MTFNALLIVDENTNGKPINVLCFKLSYGYFLDRKRFGLERCLILFAIKSYIQWFHNWIMNWIINQKYADKCDTKTVVDPVILVMVISSSSTYKTF